jgi:hypothetical protein
MKLFLVHCGFYDGEVFDGVYESHVNFFVAAESFDDARARARLNPTYQGKKMHVDGLQRVDAVDGFDVALTPNPGLGGASMVAGSRHRELAPKKPGESA